MLCYRRQELYSKDQSHDLVLHQLQQTDPAVLSANARSSRAESTESIRAVPTVGIIARMTDVLICGSHPCIKFT